MFKSLLASVPLIKPPNILNNFLSVCSLKSSVIFSHDNTSFNISDKSHSFEMILPFISASMRQIVDCIIILLFTSLKSIGNVKSFIDGTTVALNQLSKQSLLTSASLLNMNAEQIALAANTGKLSIAEVAEILVAKNFTKEKAKQALILAGYEPELVDSTLEMYSFAAAETTAAGTTAGLSTALTGLGAVIKAHPILFTISALLAIVPLAIKLFDDWTVSAEEAAEAIKVRDRRNSRFPSIAATAAAVDGFACSDQAPCPVDTTRSGGDGGGMTTGTG